MRHILQDDNLVVRGRMEVSIRAGNDLQQRALKAYVIVVEFSRPLGLAVSCIAASADMPELYGVSLAGFGLGHDGLHPQSARDQCTA